MPDLAEHMGTILTIMGGLLTVLGILISLIWKDLRKELKEIKAEAAKFSGWLVAMTGRGGVVTRDDHFLWCDEYSKKCPAVMAIDTISLWRNTMLEKGGVLTRTEHTQMCKEVTRELVDRFCERMDELFEHHREWVGQEMKLIRTEISNVKKT